MALNPFEAQLFYESGLMGITDEHIEKVGDTLISSGKSKIDRSTFEAACFKNGVEPSSFHQNDLDDLQDYLMLTE